MSQMQVFLSHSSQDKPFADALVGALRQAGADVWYDEESLGAGHLRRTIMKELADRPVFVVLLSKTALGSQWVLDECEWAYDLQRSDPSRIMLPVVVAPLDEADLNAALYLRSFKRVEAGDLRPLPVDEAARLTLRLLGLTPHEQTPATPAAAPAPTLAAASQESAAAGLAPAAVGTTPPTPEAVSPTLTAMPSTPMSVFPLPGDASSAPDAPTSSNRTPPSAAAQSPELNAPELKALERPAGSVAPPGFLFTKLLDRAKVGNLVMGRTQTLVWEFALADSPSERHKVQMVYNVGLLRGPLSPLTFIADGLDSGTFNLNRWGAGPHEVTFTAGGLGYVFEWERVGGSWRGSLKVNRHVLCTVWIPNDDFLIRVEPQG